MEKNMLKGFSFLSRDNCVFNQLAQNIMIAHWWRESDFKTLFHFIKKLKNIPIETILNFFNGS